MKKLAVLLVFLALFHSVPSHAQTAPAPVYACPVGGCGPAFWPFFSSVVAMEALVYLNATGVDFPLCQKNWLNAPQQPGRKCYPDYPEAIHKDGV